MPNDKDNNSDPVQNGEGGMLKSLILLALPWLSFHLEILSAIKKGVEEHKKEKDTGSDYIKPIQHLVAREIHALLMILDPSRKLRGLIDTDLEKTLIDEFTEIFEKLAAGSVNFIEVQEIILTRISYVLKKLKNGNETKSAQV